MCINFSEVAKWSLNLFANLMQVGFSPSQTIIFYRSLASQGHNAEIYIFFSRYVNTLAVEQKRFRIVRTPIALF